MVSIKICGLTREADVEMAVAAGADIIGVVIIETSPRYAPLDRALALIRRAASLGAEPWVVATAAVTWLDRLIDAAPEIGAVQMHGRETPGQIAAFARRHQLLPVIKAMGIASARDLEEAAEFEAADAFLFDAKPPHGADREGGHGRSFDWSLLKGFRVNDHEDWTLSGGLTPETVAAAIRQSGAPAVDVSSGVEAAPGIKDRGKVEAFISAVRAVG